MDAGPLAAPGVDSAAGVDVAAGVAAAGAVCDAGMAADGSDTITILMAALRSVTTAPAAAAGLGSCAAGGKLTVEMTVGTTTFLAAAAPVRSPAGVLDGDLEALTDSAATEMNSLLIALAVVVIGTAVTVFTLVLFDAADEMLGPCPAGDVKVAPAYINHSYAYNQVYLHISGCASGWLCCHWLRAIEGCLSKPNVSIEIQL